MVVRAAVVKTPVQSALRLREWEMGVGMSVVRRGELLTLLLGRRGSGAAGHGRELGGWWRRHQCRLSGSVGRGNGGLSAE
jgi:hypothetical protein